MHSPLILFTYNRPVHTRQTLEALKQNILADKTPLFIFSDAPSPGQEREVLEVRQLIRAVNGFASVTVIERQTHLGLAQSVIQGVTEVLRQFPSVIVFEDDLVCTPHTLSYFNQALQQYHDNPRIGSITAYTPPVAYPRQEVYLNPRFGCWGWATWKDRWDKVNWDVPGLGGFLADPLLVDIFNYTGPNKTEMLVQSVKGEKDTWAIRFCYAHFLFNQYCIFPAQSLVNNTGHDGSGVNSHNDTRYWQDRLYAGIPDLPGVLEENKAMVAAYARFYRPTALQRLKRALQGLRA